MTRLRALALLAPLALGACAERGVVSGPEGTTSGPARAAAVLAAGLVVGVLAALVLTSARERGGAGLAAGVLAVQAAAGWLGGALLVGTALRSRQLLDRPADAEQAASLVSLSGLDGREPEFFHLMVAVVAVLGGLTVALLVLTARLAAGRNRVERAVATAVLALETVASAIAVGVVVTGDRGRVILVAAALLPLLAVATWSAWPRSAASAPSAVRVQRRHA